MDSYQPPSDWFVDWLTVQEDHEDRLPVVGQTEVMAHDLATGLCEWTAIKGVAHRGSFESSLLVRCDGRRISISGNPSRWNRSDNFQGIHDLAECIALYNRVLQGFGLPAFSDSASVSRVDLTTNHATGSERNLLACMRYLAGQRHYRSPQVWPDFRGLQFGTNRSYTALKFYDKGTEIRKRAKGDEYLLRLADWCSDRGVIREEWTLGRKWLAENRLNRVGTVCTDKIVELVERKREIPRRLDTGRVTLAEVAERLQELGVVKDRATAVRVQGYAHAWASGTDLRAELPRRTFYRIRRQLLACGLDVNHPLDVQRITPRVDQVRLEPAGVPEWYVAA